MRPVMGNSAKNSPNIIWIIIAIQKFGMEEPKSAIVREI